jgi:hypothetical protein
MTLFICKATRQHSLSSDSLVKKKKGGAGLATTKKEITFFLFLSD